MNTPQIKSAFRWMIFENSAQFFFKYPRETRLYIAREDVRGGAGGACATP